MISEIVQAMRFSCPVSNVEASVLRRWLRERLRRNDGVIIDTETTDLLGHCVQISVIDMRGEVLLDQLVHPPVPITEQARRCHGISNDDLINAPSLGQVIPRLSAVVAGKKILAYNAAFDHDVLDRGYRHARIQDNHIQGKRSWRCVMRMRSIINRSPRWQRLGGDHSALGDCRKTLDVIHALTANARDTDHQAEGVRA